MSESQRIADQLRRAFDGDPWHGSSLATLLDGLSAEDAFQRPIPGGASIWEVLLHMNAWTAEVHRRLSGGRPGVPEGGDWPPVTDRSAGAWKDFLHAMTEVHEALLRDVEILPESRLNDLVGDPERSRELGSGVTYYVMLHGLAQHNVYHSAQVASMRKILAARPPRRVRKEGTGRGV
jgi:uncharacterized damage-inducible protein DinB